MLKWGMLDPRGYGLGYAFEIGSHRLLRYLTPWLHLVALGANLALLGEGWVYTVTLVLQLGLLAAAALGRFLPLLPFRVAYYYVTVTASIAAGLWDRLRRDARPDRLGEDRGNQVTEQGDQQSAFPIEIDEEPRPRRGAVARGRPNHRGAWADRCLADPPRRRGRDPIGSRGPVIYRQRRVGQHGEIFELWKLRTMKRGADLIGVGTAVIDDDPRVTRAGRLLRRFSLDGSRTSSTSSGRWRSSALAQPSRLRSRALHPAPAPPAGAEAGVTGWAQIHGRTAIPWEERIELDVRYVEHRPSPSTSGSSPAPRGVLFGAGGSAPDPYAGSPPDSPLRQAAEREEAGGPRG